MSQRWNPGTFSLVYKLNQTWNPGTFRRVYKLNQSFDPRQRPISHVQTRIGRETARITCINLYWQGDGPDHMHKLLLAGRRPISYV
ncbi:hypothetical protein CHS0354_041018 [Potamilus streckersoni]|uniref:Uncharacterized protein n=1 Tax=Potamilus streckersoni TaxID=2493646 RepID=A0AAE0W3J1_9BIVA|nr:hypothetical protein CHS0354_041018 [Potamilus streckersoni]